MDIVFTTKNNRDYYCARGWYYNHSNNKWARITKKEVKVSWYNKEYTYNYKEGNLVRSLTKKHWAKVNANEVPLAVFNLLEEA